MAEHLAPDAAERRIAALTARIDQLERQVATLLPVVAAVREALIWDHSAYEVCPDPSWVALDRDSAVALLGALAGADHWRPWTTTLERR